MALYDEDMSTKFKQRAMIKFLSAENISEIYYCLKTVYDKKFVHRTTVNC